METADVRRRVNGAIEQARRKAAERRIRADEAAREFDVFLERVAVPLFRTAAQALRAAGYPFNVFTPAGGVRLMSERSAHDYIELRLDATEDPPRVVGRTTFERGHRVVDTERPLHGTSPVRDLDDEAVLAFLLKELEPLVER
jgi:hypothetical protein